MDLSERTELSHRSERPKRYSDKRVARRQGTGDFRSLRNAHPAGGGFGQGREAGVRLVAGAPLVPTGRSPRPLDQVRSGMSSARSGGPGHADWRQGCHTANTWAADLYRRARDRGHDHPHAVRILARAWLHVIWRCWQGRAPYDPANHRALQRVLTAAGLTQGYSCRGSRTDLLWVRFDGRVALCGPLVRAAARGTSRVDPVPRNVDVFQVASGRQRGWATRQRTL
jgi:hypothetical protein